MKNYFPVLLFLFPFLAFGQNEVGPEGFNLILVVLLVLLLPLLFWLLRRIKLRPSRLSGWFSFVPIRVELKKDRPLRPKTLTLQVKNNKKTDIDIEAPVLMFRKIWSIRKFRLKGIDRYEIYPLYLEAGKTHELRINLNVFHEHDRKLRNYYWAKVLVQDTTGKEYSSKYVTLRKSLFS